MELFETIAGHKGEITRCKTVDLYVPSDASIVIEGFLSPTRMAQYRPNPEPNMLFCPYKMQQPVFEVFAVTMAKDPVYRHTQVTPRRPAFRLSWGNRLLTLPRQSPTGQRNGRIMKGPGRLHGMR